MYKIPKCGPVWFPVTREIIRRLEGVLREFKYDFEAEEIDELTHKTDSLYRSSSDDLRLRYCTPYPGKVSWSIDVAVYQNGVYAYHASIFVDLHEDLMIVSNTYYGHRSPGCDSLCDAIRNLFLEYHGESISDYQEEVLKNEQE